MISGVSNNSAAELDRRIVTRGEMTSRGPPVSFPIESSDEAGDAASSSKQKSDGLRKSADESRPYLEVLDCKDAHEFDVDDSVEGAGTNSFDCKAAVKSDFLGECPCIILIRSQLPLNQL